MESPRRGIHGCVIWGALESGSLESPARHVKRELTASRLLRQGPCAVRGGLVVVRESKRRRPRACV